MLWREYRGAMNIGVLWREHRGVTREHRGVMEGNIGVLWSGTKGCYEGT